MLDYMRHKERSNNQMLDEINLDNNQVLLHIVDIYMHVYIMYIIYIIDIYHIIIYEIYILIYNIYV